MDNVDPTKDTLIFQQIDLDFYEGPPMKEALTSSQKVPIFRIYGNFFFFKFNKINK
jgi:hypothetical protein